MKKIIFVTLRMADDMKRRKYPVENNQIKIPDGEFYYSSTAYLSEKMTKDDEIKVILLESEGGEHAGVKNAQLYIDELNSLNKAGAKIEYKVIRYEYTESKEKFAELYLTLVKELEENSELYAEVSFGPKSLPLVVFSILSFAEKCFDCDVKKILYLRKEYINGKIQDDKLKICDYTPIFAMNSIVNTMDFASGSQAVSTITKFFEAL